MVCARAPKDELVRAGGPDRALPGHLSLRESGANAQRGAAGGGVDELFRRGRSRRSSTRHSMTWSARRSSVCGIVIPRAFAVFILITRWNLVDCTTGRSPGGVPL